MTEKRRLTKITTRAGDKGKTKLATGRTINKYDDVVRAMGSIDELNSHIGVLMAHLPHPQLKTLTDIQQNLFNMGAVLAMEGQFDAPDCAVLEAEIEALNATLPPLTEFVLPGGGIAGASAHVCRSVARRSESDLWALIATLEEAVPAITQCAQYLNRLSDYFFVLARSLSKTTEEQWHGPSSA